MPALAMPNSKPATGCITGNSPKPTAMTTLPLIKCAAREKKRRTQNTSGTAPNLYSNCCQRLTDTTTAMFVFFTRTTSAGFVTTNFHFITHRCYWRYCFLGSVLLRLTVKTCSLIVLELHALRHGLCLL